MYIPVCICHKSVYNYAIVKQRKFRNGTKNEHSSVGGNEASAFFQIPAVGAVFDGLELIFPVPGFKFKTIIGKA